MKTEEGAQWLGAPPREFVKTFQQSHGTPIIGNFCSGPVRSGRPPHFPLRAVTVSRSLARSLGSAREAPREKLCLHQAKERKSRSDKESHNEAGVHAPGFHSLDFDWSSVLLPGPDGLPGEQVAGNRGKKESFTSE